MTATLDPAEQRFVLEDVDWAFYELLLKQVGDRHIFVTYDRGRLDQAERFLAEFHDIDQTTWMRKVRAWVRENLLP